MNLNNCVIILTVAETENDNKMGCTGLCEGVHIAQRPREMQRQWLMPVGSVPNSIGLGLGSGSVNVPSDSHSHLLPY